MILYGKQKTKGCGQLETNTWWCYTTRKSQSIDIKPLVFYYQENKTKFYKQLNNKDCLCICMKNIDYNVKDFYV